jgi:EAL domain-containing protein (putative c-di-GMP-specific phosphodiesterase class I)
LDNSVHIGASIGIARYPIDGDNPFTLTKNADAAMYAAKANGRNTSCFFSKSLGEKVSNYLNIRTQIAQGLQRDEFLIHLQPEVDLQTGKILSVEALLRWKHPSRGLLLPEEFISVAEDSGLIVELGDFVLDEALRIVRRLRDLGWADLRVAVNISGRQIMLPHFADRVINCLKDHQLPGQALIVEITESMVLHDLENAVQVLRHLKRQGIDAAIDDFGKGYSSLNHLHQLPVEFIKIDQSFVFEADVARESETIIRAIVAMAQSLGLKTIAEGIERSSQQTLLTHLGCDIGQGFLYSKPLPYGRLLDFLVSTESTAHC